MRTSRFTCHLLSLGAKCARIFLRALLESLTINQNTERNIRCKQQIYARRTVPRIFVRKIWFSKLRTTAYPVYRTISLLLSLQSSATVQGVFIREGHRGCTSRTSFVLSTTSSRGRVVCMKCGSSKLSRVLFYRTHCQDLRRKINMLRRTSTVFC